MSIAILQRARYWQPSASGYGIDQSNPLSCGLIHVFVGSTGFRNIATNLPYETVTGSPVVGIGPSGLALLGDASTKYVSTATAGVSSLPISIGVLMVGTANSYEGAFGICKGGTTGDYALGGHSTFSGNSYAAYWGNNTVIASDSGYSLLGSAKAFVARSRSTTDHALITNKVTTSSTSTGALSSPLAVVGATIFSSYANIHLGASSRLYLACAWNRALSDAEAFSFNANPWQLFTKRRMFVPVSAGVSLPTLSAATYMPSSITSSGFRPRVTAS